MGLHLPKRVRKIGLLALLPVVLVLSSCSQESQDEWSRVAMPEGASDKSGPAIEFWQWTWVAAMIIGVLVWGLIIFAAIRYRRRSDDEIPVQTRYNLPMEILYTVAPVIVVLVFFKFVVDTQNEETKAFADPQHTIRVVGQQWSWTFNYLDSEALGGGGSGDIAECEGGDNDACVYEVGTPAQLPTLYLPVGETIRFEFSSPDVVHDFWVPAFSYKIDVVPGRLNAFDLRPTREGTFAGKCAELCGTYHSRMLFNVEVVSAEEYAEQLQRLQDRGNVGVAIGGSETITQDGLNDRQTEETE